MNKRPLIGIVVAMMLVVAYYLLSPLWRTRTANDPSPLASGIATSHTPEALPPAMRIEYDAAMERAKTDTKTMADVMPAQPVLIAEAPFVARAHGVKGKALLIRAGDRSIVRFEGFETINGPDVRVWLATDLDGKDHVELDKLKATSGNVNYDVPVGTDTARKRFVLIWCVRFGVLFSSAEFPSG